MCAYPDVNSCKSGAAVGWVSKSRIWKPDLPGRVTDGAQSRAANASSILCGPRDCGPTRGEISARVQGFRSNQAGKEDLYRHKVELKRSQKRKLVRILRQETGSEEANSE